jgi:hypothetical protein
MGRAGRLSVLAINKFMNEQPESIIMWLADLGAGDARLFKLWRVRDDPERPTQSPERRSVVAAKADYFTV